MDVSESVWIDFRIDGCSPLVFSERWSYNVMHVENIYYSISMQSTWKRQSQVMVKCFDSSKLLSFANRSLDVAV